MIRSERKVSSRSTAWTDRGTRGCAHATKDADKNGATTPTKISDRTYCFASMVLFLFPRHK